MNAERTNAPDLLVLCGGQGTRLRSVLSDRPKPLAMIGSRPFLDFVIAPFVRQGVNRVILCSGYLGYQFEEWYADHPGPFELLYSREAMPLGTAGAIRHASPKITGDIVVVVNGDSVCEIDLHALLERHMEKKACATLTLAHADGRGDVGVVAMDEQHRITAFCEKRISWSAGFQNAGIYVFNRSAIDLIPANRPYSLESDWLPSLIPSGVYGYVNPWPLYDIGTPERLALFRTSACSDGISPVLRAPRSVTSA
jgi:NDP-sugar pyrophosphorylase family protein